MSHVTTTLTCSGRAAGQGEAAARRSTSLARRLCATLLRQTARPERDGLSAHLCRDIGDVRPEPEKDPIWYAGGSIW